MNLSTTGERRGGRCMTAVACRGDRAGGNVGSEGMRMGVVIEVTGMAILAVIGSSVADRTAYE